jgi:hypothetical protein
MILQKVQEYPDISISSTTTTITLADSRDDPHSGTKRE